MVEQSASSVVKVELKLDENLQRLLDPQDQLAVAVREAIERGVGDVVRVLGVPASVSVELSLWSRAGRQAGQRWIRLCVNSQVCRFPDQLLRFVYSYVDETLPSAGTSAQTVLGWLKKTLEDSPADRRQEERIAEFFRLTCAQAIKGSAAFLLAEPQVEAYVASLPRPQSREKNNPWPPSPSVLLPILRTALNAKLSIGDTAVVAQILGDPDRAAEDLLEDLLDALPPEAIEICIPQAFRSELEAAGAAREAELIKFLREDLYGQLGVLYPQFRFVVDERLKPNCVAFRINHLTMLPILCPRPDQCLVNDTVERLRLMKVEGRPTTNPATWRPSAIVDIKYKDMLESIGLTTWDQWGFLTLTLAEALRKNAGCFVHRTFTELQLRELRTAFPAVVDAVLKFFSVEEITRIVRMLVEDELSVRDLRLVCEGLLDYRYRSPDASRYLILDDRLSNWGTLEEPGDGSTTDVVSFVRMRLKRQITHKRSYGTNTLVVYLLDGKLEALVSSVANGRDDLMLSGSLEDEEQKDVILDAIRAELQHLPPTAQMPLLLTSINVRSPLKKIIAKEFPRLFVIGYQELTPDVNVQPVARVAPS